MLYDAAFHFRPLYNNWPCLAVKAAFLPRLYRSRVSVAGGNRRRWGAISGGNRNANTVCINLCHSLILQTLQIIVLGLVAAVSALPNPSVQTAYGYGQGGSYVLSSSVACLPGDLCERPPFPTRPVGGDPSRSEFRHHAKANKRSADPSVQTAYGYGQGGSYVLSSSVACLPGDPCNLPAFPTRPVGGAPFRSEFRHHAKAN